MGINPEEAWDGIGINPEDAAGRLYRGPLLWRIGTCGGG